MLVKKSSSSDTSARSISKRIKLLHHFLSELLSERIFKSTNEVFAFLSAGKESFERTKAEIAKTDYPKDVSEIPHVEGKADITITDQKIALSANVSKFCVETAALYERLKGSNKKVAEAMGNLSSLLAERADIFKALSITNASIKVFPANTPKCAEMAKVWNLMKLQSSNQSEYLKVQAQLVKEHLRDLLKQFKSHMDSVAEVRARHM